MATVPGVVGREAKKARALLYSGQSWLSEYRSRLVSNEIIAA
jgi:hypothetical protein